MVCETEPVLYLDIDFLSSQHSSPELEVAVWKRFDAVVPPDKKEKYLTLFGPTTGASADRFRSNAMQMRSTNVHPLNDAEIDNLVKVMQVMKFNAFTMDDQSRAIYSELTRFSHSCSPNCTFSFRGTAVNCYAKKQINAGEELTISYIATSDVDPTHERRYQCLETKEFTCHCPRCDAVGDDTRQFDCFDPACKGVMMVCQPINKKKTSNSSLSYTGVEYAEPHLLPCTVCHRAAPADYQTKMFTLENGMLKVCSMWKPKFDDTLGEHTTAEQESLLEGFLAVPIQHRHAAALPILRVGMKLKAALHAKRICSPDEVQQAVMEYMSALEYIIPHPSDYLVQQVCDVAVLVSSSSVFSLKIEKDYCTKALRMFLLVLGRDMRESLLDEIVLKSHQMLSSARPTEVCAFCVSTACGPHTESLQSVQAGDLL